MVLAVALLLGVLAAAHRGDSGFISTATTATGQPWLGFGTNQYPLDRNASGKDTPWTSSDWHLTASRLAFMHPGLSRINLLLGWFNPTGNLRTFDWHSWQMQNLYRVLSWYSQAGLRVQIGMWHDVLSGPPDNPGVYTSRAWARAQAALMNQLVNVEGFTNIYGYAGINEWNCSYMYPAHGFSFPDWQTATRRLAAAFAADRLSVALIGPDAGCTASPAVIDAARDDAGLLSAYEDHDYMTQGQVIGDQAERAYASVIDRVDSADAGRKPVYLAEMGVSNPDYSPTPPINSYAYGLDMFDYGVQVLRSGAAGALAWCLDGFDQGKNCGLWNISGKGGGTALRPWFYPWSLLSRYFPEGATIYPMPEQAGLRIAAARVPAGVASSNWTFALVNRNPGKSLVVTLRVPGSGSGVFDEYVYSTSSRTVARSGFPTAVRRIQTGNGGLQEGLTVTVAANSAVLLTTLNHSPVPRT